MNNKYNKTVIALAVSFFSLPSLAMQVLEDVDLSQINAQDGLNITLDYSQLDIERVFWEDKMGQSDNTQVARRAYFDSVKSTGTDLGLDASLDFATSSTNTPAMYLDMAAKYGTLQIGRVEVCDDLGNNCSPTLGGLAIQSSEPLVFKILSDNGLLSQSSNGQITLGIRNTNIYWTLLQDTTQNQVIYKDFNFNFFGKGSMWVDTDGLHLASKGSGNYIDFARVNDTGAHASVTNAKKPGVNIEMMYKGAVPANEFSLNNAKGLIRLGASGRAVESEIVIKGTDVASMADNILGDAYDASGNTTSGTNSKILGSTGVMMKLRGEFTNADNLAGGEEFSLELAHAGNNAYGFEFSNLKPLQVRKTIDSSGGQLNDNRAYIDMGSVYINLLRSKTVSLPQNSILTTAPLGATTVASSTDYQHIAMPNADVDGVAIAVRDMDFQAVSRRGRFIISNDVPMTDPGRIGLNDSTSNAWGLGLPIYNLDANFVLYGATAGLNQRLGFSLGMSTEGVSPTGDRTTSILLVDGAPNSSDGGQPTSYYFGLRNINMLLTADGTIGLEDGKINLDLPNLLFAASFQVAAGYLPGSRYRTSTFTGCTTTEVACYVPLNSFTTDTDAAFGVNLRLKGSMNLNLIPGGNTLADNNIRFQGRYTMTEGSIQIVDVVDKSVLGLDNLKGVIDFDNAIKINKDNVNFSYAFNVNPNKTPADVLKIQNINLYPPTPTGTGPAQRLGEMVMTGGQLNSSFTLTPF